MKIIDESTPGTAPKPSMFLHGLTGDGKSYWAETGGIPLVVLLEVKAQSVLRQINPKAIGIVPESLDDLDNLMAYLGSPAKLAAKNIDRIILDSFTELTLAIPRWLREKAGPVGTLVKLELAEYGSLGDYALAVVKAIQLTGYPSVVIGRSTSKRVGLVESIRPDGLGKSIEQLPGKLLPTAQARFDSELGYVIDTTPADHSQRCGLPWVPPIWTGSCLDYLRVIEAGPQGGEHPAQPAAAETQTARPTTAPAAAGASGKPAPTAGATGKTELADDRFENALVELNQKLHKAGWPEAERGRCVESYRTLGAGSLDTLFTYMASGLIESRSPAAERKTGSGPTVAELPAMPPPGSADPAWVALTTGLNPDMLASWGRAYVANPDKAKLDLAEFQAATARLAALGTTPDPELDPKGYQKAFGDMVTLLRAEKQAKPQDIPAAAAEFADAVAKGTPRATAEDITKLTDLCIALKVDMDCLWSYALEKGGASLSADGSKNWRSLSADFLGRIMPQFEDVQKRVAVISWLHKKYRKIPF